MIYKGNAFYDNNIIFIAEQKSELLFEVSRKNLKYIYLYLFIHFPYLFSFNCVQ